MHSVLKYVLILPSQLLVDLAWRNLSAAISLLMLLLYLFFVTILRR